MLGVEMSSGNLPMQGYPPPRDSSHNLRLGAQLLLRVAGATLTDLSAHAKKGIVTEVNRLHAQIHTDPAVLALPSVVRHLADALWALREHVGGEKLYRPFIMLYHTGDDSSHTTAYSLAHPGPGGEAHALTLSELLNVAGGDEKPYFFGWIASHTTPMFYELKHASAAASAAALVAQQATIASLEETIANLRAEHREQLRRASSAAREPDDDDEHREHDRLSLGSGGGDSDGDDGDALERDYDGADPDGADGADD